MTTYRIVEDAGGFFLSDESLDYIDVRGRAYPCPAVATLALEEGDTLTPSSLLAIEKHGYCNACCDDESSITEEK